MNNHTDTTYTYAFLDSGSGGLPYLAQLRSHAPDASCVYVADTKHFPYGEKTREEVISFAIEATGHILERFRPEVVVVACNTMSVAALQALRAAYDVPFVGTVPAIKLASSVSRNRKIGLLATERTVRDPYTDKLIAEFARDCEIVRIGDSTLIAKIERELVTASREERLAAVRPSIDRFRAAGVDTIILACTHFLHVDDEIREVAGSDIQVIDSREGVAQQALRLVPPRGDGIADHGEGACYITGAVSAGTEELYKKYSAMFGITWGGIL
jgi:glutamate racemase